MRIAFGQERLQPVDLVAKGWRKWALRDRAGALAGRGQSVLQVPEAQAAVRLDRHHGNAKLPAQPLGVDLQSMVLGHIDHRERDHQRPA